MYHWRFRFPFMRRTGMKRLGNWVIAGVVKISLLCFLMSCGGGGDASTSRGGGQDASLTASNAQQVGDTIVQAVKLVAPTSTLGDLKASRSSSAKRPPLASVLEKVLSVSINSGITMHSSALTTINNSFAGGGNIAININSVNPVNKVIKADVDVNTCTTGTETLNGTMSVEYVMKSMGDLTDPTLDNLKNFEKLTITTAHFTYVDTANNDNVTLSDITLVLKDFTYNGNILTGGQVTLGGSVAGAIGDEQINVECDSLRLVFASDPSGSMTVSVSGRINASCLGGWVRITTNSPVFVPADGGCPTAGDIVASAGGNAVRMVIAEDSGISVYFNSDLIETFKSCNEVRGLCGG
jgi:hypothetical protein